MKVLLGKKDHMTQYFDSEAVAHAVTVISLGEMTIVSLKSKAKHGYDAIQVGYGLQKESRMSKAVLGNLKGMQPFKKLLEFRVENSSIYTVGQVLGVEQFSAGDIIEVSGISKGKGFQGGVKRHGFKGKGSIHNVRHALRELGSIGGGGRAGGRVVKGKKMPGRMGADRITVKNLKVMAIDTKTKTILVKGAIPGNPGGMVELKSNK
jgi:large subunit ribosomal protein L3